MNFLAHALLAGDLDADRVGGVLGDFVKGLLPAGLPPDLASGVELHRAIDAFAERHPAFIASRARVSPLRRRVSGVLVDLFYDHLLARDWPERAAGQVGDRAVESLETFSAQLHAAVFFHIDEFPGRAREVAELMRAQNWLCSYRDSAMVGQAIDRMAIYRLRRANTLAGGIEEFFADRTGFEVDFRDFLPDALGFARQWRRARDERKSSSRK